MYSLLMIVFMISGICCKSDRIMMLSCFGLAAIFAIADSIYYVGMNIKKCLEKENDNNIDKDKKEKEK